MAFDAFYSAGYVFVIDFADQRRGVVELTTADYFYGGCARDRERAVHFDIDFSNPYMPMLRELEAFFRGAPPPCTMKDALEVLAILDAAEKSLHSKQIEPVWQM